MDEVFSILESFCKEFEAAGAQVYVSCAYVDYNTRQHRITRSIDDTLRQWHPESEWKSFVIDWLAYQLTDNQHDEYLWEDDEDYKPEEYDRWD